MNRSPARTKIVVRLADNVWALSPAIAPMRVSKRLIVVATRDSRLSTDTSAPPADLAAWRGVRAPPTQGRRRAPAPNTQPRASARRRPISLRAFECPACRRVAWHCCPGCRVAARVLMTPNGGTAPMLLAHTESHHDLPPLGTCWVVRSSLVGPASAGAGPDACPWCSFW